MKTRKRTVILFAVLNDSKEVVGECTCKFWAEPATTWSRATCATLAVLTDKAVACEITRLRFDHKHMKNLGWVNLFGNVQLYKTGGNYRGIWSRGRWCNRRLNLFKSHFTNGDASLPEERISLCILPQLNFHLINSLK